LGRKRFVDLIEPYGALPVSTNHPTVAGDVHVDLTKNHDGGIDSRHGTDAAVLF
jgi:hypothetical protein